ncbi:MAG: hypothetical protein AAF497_13220 [Planctomycetota bacterium]
MTNWEGSRREPIALDVIVGLWRLEFKQLLQCIQAFISFFGA